MVQMARWDAFEGNGEQMTAPEFIVDASLERAVWDASISLVELSRS